MRTQHVIRIFLRNESQWNVKKFGGFYVDDGTTLLPAPSKPTRTIEFIGDSWTAGYGVEAGNCNLNTVSDINKSWAGLTRDAFHAHGSFLAWSGRGMVHNLEDATNGGISPDAVPHYYDSIMCEATWFSGTHLWDFSKMDVNLVVICLGINDYSTNFPGSSAYITAYRSFINRIWGHYPNAKILTIQTHSIFNSSNMDNDVRSVVTAESTSIHQITSVGIPSGLSLSGCDWHPSISDQQAIANIVIAKIVSFMQWDTLTPNVSGITLSSLVTNPTSFVNDSVHDLSFSTTATDADGTISSVTLNLSSLAGPSSVAMTKSGDNFTYTFKVASGLGVGVKTVTATATDNKGNTKTTSTKVTVSNPPGTLTVLNIYTDTQIYPGFNETAMSSVAPKEMTTGASEGTHCFKVTFSLNNWWDDFGFVVNNWNGSYNLTGYDTIAFDIKGPSLKGVTMSFNMQAGDNSGEGVDLKGLSADSYITMKIPLSNFSSLGLSSISSLYFGLSGLENGSGTVYIDNIKAFSGSGSLTTRISRDVLVATKPGKINYVNTVGRTMNIFTTGSGTLKIFNIAGEIVNQIYVSQTQNHVWTAHTAGLYLITMENICSQKVVLK